MVMHDPLRASRSIARLHPPAIALACLLVLGCASGTPSPDTAAQPSGGIATAAGRGGGAPAPLPNAHKRPTALRFGMYVTPDPGRNPIDPPERFTGYHVGLDFELLPREVNRTVAVYAICNGAILYSGFAKGYGGLVVQRCQIEGERVTVLYGHLDTHDAPPEDIVVKTGEQVGILAPPYSTESDGNRKHLHLGIRRGEFSDFRGYVQKAEDVYLFMDPVSVLAPGASGVPVLRYIADQGPLSRP